MYDYKIYIISDHISLTIPIGNSQYLIGRDIATNTYQEQ